MCHRPFPAEFEDCAETFRAMRSRGRGLARLERTARSIVAKPRREVEAHGAVHLLGARFRRGTAPTAPLFTPPCADG